MKFRLIFLLGLALFFLSANFGGIKAISAPVVKRDFFSDVVKNAQRGPDIDMSNANFQGLLENEAAEKSLAQDEFEREMILAIQNLNAKTHMTKKEKKEFRSVYRPMPKTVDEYKVMSKDIKRAERQNAKPVAPQDAKLVKIDEPRFVLVKYNSPPGIRNIDLRNLRDKRAINSIGVVSPKKDKLAYTAVYYEGYNDKVSSEVYYIPLDTSKPLKAAVKTASLVNQTPVKLLQTGMSEEYPTLFRTLTVVDWSEDGTKIAVKERIGSSTFGIWQTNLWVYDLNDNTSKQLVEVRDAVKYWWKKNRKVNLDDYRWDIIPLGWDEVNKDRIVVCAYAYTKDRSSKFLGMFSVDSKGNNSQLISINPMSVKISANGLMLKAVPTAF